jgi:hypothetical protein
MPDVSFALADASFRFSGYAAAKLLGLEVDVVTLVSMW